MIWNAERVEKIKQLWTDGFSAGQIAVELGGVTRNAVIGKVNRLGLSGRGWPTSCVKRQRRTKPSKAKLDRAAEEHAHAAFVRRFRPTSRGAAATNLANKIETKLREDDGGPKYPPSVEMADAPVSKRLTLLELTPHACRYIEDESPPWTYCAHDALPGKSWCAAHYALCVNTVSTKEANRRADRAAKWR